MFWLLFTGPPRYLYGPTRSGGVPLRPSAEPPGVPGCLAAEVQCPRLERGAGTVPVSAESYTG